MIQAYWLYFDVPIIIGMFQLPSIKYGYEHSAVALCDFISLCAQETSFSLSVLRGKLNTCTLTAGTLVRICGSLINFVTRDVAPTLVTHDLQRLLECDDIFQPLTRMT